MPETGGHNWYLVFAQASGEFRAAANLARQGYGVYVPSYLKQRRHARKVETVPAPLFPRYLFVGMDVSVQRWTPVRSTPGVISLIAQGERPTAVPLGLVDELRQREDAHGYVQLGPQAARFRAGDAVRVLSGAFEALQGVFESATDHERVSILLSLMGRQVRVVLGADALEAA